MRLEGLGKLKFNDISGNRTHDVPACSIVPQPTTLPRAPGKIYIFSIRLNRYSCKMSAQKKPRYRATNKEWEEQHFFDNFTAICEPII
jgi:hypothetical protein